MVRPTTQQAYTVSNASGSILVPVQEARDPTSLDVNYQLYQQWVNTSNFNLWQLMSFVSTSGTVLANWFQLEGTTSEVHTLTGNSGGAVSPTSNNINILGTAGQITVTGDPATSTLTLALTGGSTAVDSFAPDTGTNPVLPTALGLVNVKGQSTPNTSGIQVTGGTNELDIAMFSPFAGNFTFTSSTSGATEVLTVSNSSNTANSQAEINATVAGTTAGDAWNQWTIGSSRSYALGPDTSDGGANAKLKLNTNTSASVSPSSGTNLFYHDPTPSAIAQPLTPVSRFTNTNRLILETTSPGQRISVECTQNDFANAASSAGVISRVAGAAGSVTGDAWMSTVGNLDWVWGESAAVPAVPVFKFGHGGTPSNLAAVFYTIDTSGIINIPNSLYIGDSSPVSTTAFIVQKESAGSTLTGEIRNGSGTANSAAQLSLVTGGVPGGTHGNGDSFIVFQSALETDWSLGQDFSDNKAFKISKNNGLGTNDVLTIDTSGNVDAVAGDLSVNRSDNGGTVLLQSSNSSNTASSNAVISAVVAGASAGDCFFDLDIPLTRNWDIGIRNSDSQALYVTTDTTNGSLATTLVMKATTAGQITMPLQPAFFAYLAATVTDKTGSGASYTLGTDALTEVYDRGNNFNTNGTFTAPVTGVYDLRAQITLTGLTIATSFVISVVISGTSARTYINTFTRAALATDQSVSISTLALMTATDTATVTIVASGEAGNTDDILGAATAQSYFCGTLVC